MPTPLNPTLRSLALLGLVLLPRRFTESLLAAGEAISRKPGFASALILESMGHQPPLQLLADSALGLFQRLDIRRILVDGDRGRKALVDVELVPLQLAKASVASVLGLGNHCGEAMGKEHEPEKCKRTKGWIERDELPRVHVYMYAYIYLISFNSN